MGRNTKEGLVLPPCIPWIDLGTRIPFSSWVSLPLDVRGNVMIVLYNNLLADNMELASHTLEPRRSGRAVDKSAEKFHADKWPFKVYRELPSVFCISRAGGIKLYLGI